mgnify:FL=1
MTHVFLLIVYLGQNIVNQNMYFQSIDTCKYFAERLNNQPSIPNPRAGDGDPKTHNYIAVCEPRRVDPEKTKIY